MMRRNTLWCAAAALAVVQVGCGDGVQGDDEVATSGSTTVASIVGPEEQVLEIRDVGEGTFGYFQSGKLGSNPMVIDQALLDRGDPIEVFRKLAPGREIPQALVAATRRSKDLLARTPGLHTLDTDLSLTSSGADPAGIESTQQALSSRDVHNSGLTFQSGGCPVNWFIAARSAGNPLCPTEGDSLCVTQVGWAFFQHPRAWNAYGAVCTISGIATMRATVNTTTDVFAVPAGVWRYIQYAGLRTCSGGKCVPARSFQKFEIPPGNAVANFGARTF